MVVSVRTSEHTGLSNKCSPHSVKGLAGLLEEGAERSAPTYLQLVSPPHVAAACE